MTNYRFWTKEEDELILKRYGKWNISTLSKSISRTPRAIQCRIKQLEGTFACSIISGNMSTRDVAEIMGVDISTIQRLIKSRSIQYVKPNSQYFIPELSFWSWLKDNLNRVNFKNIDSSIELIAPEWYLKEIKWHKRNPSKLIGGRNEWSAFEETTAWYMFIKGKTNREISEELGRTVDSVKQKMHKMKKKKLQKAS